MSGMSTSRPEQPVVCPSGNPAWWCERVKTEKVLPPRSVRTAIQKSIDRMDLDGRVALVTGATSGIGMETAAALAGKLR